MPFHRAVQFEAEPRARPARGHVHADGDAGDETVHDGERLRRRFRPARPFQPLQQSGDRIAGDALEEDPERLRGTPRQGPGLEHEGGVRQGLEDARDPAENLLAHAPAGDRGERRDQSGGIPVLGDPFPRPRGGPPRREEDPGRRRPARREAGQIVFQHRGGDGTGEIRVRIPGLLAQPGRERGRRRAGFGARALADVMPPQPGPRAQDHEEVGVPTRLPEMELEAEMGVDHGTGQQFRPAQEALPAGRVEQPGREQRAAPAEDRREVGARHGPRAVSRPRTRPATRRRGRPAPAPGRPRPGPRAAGAPDGRRPRRPRGPRR